MTSIHQLIYETLANDAVDAVQITGLDAQSVFTRRQIVLSFLETHEWDEEKFKPYYLEQMNLIHQARRDPALPSTGQMAKNFFTAATQHLRAGWSRCDEEQSKERYLVCKECDKLRTDGRCSICGCYMEVKATWKEQKCPIGKW